MNKQTLGTCGNCGGAVTVDTIFWSVVPPTPSCEGCGATPIQAHGPVIPMNPPRKTWTGASSHAYELLGTRYELKGADTAYFNKLSLDNEELRKQYLLGTWEYFGDDGELQEP